MSKHEWVTTRVGHGIKQCRWCSMTYMEAIVLGDECDSAPPDPAISAAITTYLAATATPAPDPALVSGWRDIATAPKQGSFLAYTPEYGRRIIRWASGAECWIQASGRDFSQSFVWQPLPAPPKGREGE